MLVKMEASISSIDKQVQSLRSSRHDHSNWLQKVEQRSAMNEKGISDLSAEVRDIDISVESLKSTVQQIEKSLREAIAEIKETVSVEKMKLGLIMAGIGFASGIISSVVTAVIITRMIG